MPLDITTAAVERVLALDPQRSLTETLAQVATETRATCAALFVARGDVKMRANVGADQDCLDRVHAAWRDEEQRVRLRSERPLWVGSWCIWPCRSSQGVLLMLYIAGPSLNLPRVRATVEGVEALINMLINVDTLAPSAGSEAVVDLYLKSTPTEEVERRHLTVALNEHEWNIARTARALGVTRLTIYKRMKKLGIKRLKVRRSEGPIRVTTE